MGKREDNAILTKSKDFAIRIVNLYKYLSSEKREYVLSKQILRSRTSIGANVHEAEESFSDKDFQYKMYIALKEARETEYWLELLFRTEYIGQKQYNSLNTDCIEILKILVSIAKTLNGKKSGKNVMNNTDAYPDDNADDPNSKF